MNDSGTQGSGDGATPFEHCRSTALAWLSRESDRLGHPGLTTAVQAAQRGFAFGRAPSFLVGSFADSEFAQTIEHVASLGHDGSLSVFGGGIWAVLWFESGRVVHASCPSTTGRGAVRACLNLLEGWFVFLPGVLAPGSPRSLPRGSSVTGLLLDILRELDEQRAGHRSSREAAQGSATELELQLPPEEVLELRKLARALRDARMERARAELDAWYYREDASRVERHQEAEKRCQTRLFQWLASRSAFEVVDSLRALDSVSAQLEMLEALVARAGERSVQGPDSDAFRNGRDDAPTWSVLEEDD